MLKEPKTGVLITNLGSPDAPNKKAVKQYLKQFLSDTRVIQPVVGKWVWWLILNGIILNTRPKKSAKLYQSIWNTFGIGAPLLAITQKQLKALKKRFNSDNIEIAMAMRYGKPSIESAIDSLIEKGISRVIILPLYPQYSRTTTASTFDVIQAMKEKNSHFPKLRLIKDYHLHPQYIHALSQSIIKHWHKYGRPQKLIISFHGIPEIYVENGDIYPQQCQSTTSLLIKSLGLNEDEYLMCYQSIFGKLEWLKPYLNRTLKSLPAQGIKDVQIICPGFAADCLETLEEIEHENKAYFIAAGGEKYSYIPALNDDSLHIDCLSKIINDNIKPDS